MEVNVVWKENMQFLGTSANGHTTLMDAGVYAGGDGQGPSPMELILQAVAGCTGIDIVQTIKKMRMDIAKFEIKVMGTRAEEHPRRFTDITIVYNFEGESLDPKKLKRAIDLSMDKYCSVSKSLNADIRYDYTINGEIIK
ncbi:OsmC family protein [Desulfuribacillus alkaliarsenatis]|uniref:Peroxiredoxin n=1 Tax=Desulfuribacillus alkaliarsenatis TaxID=766136 RepID=A0A1E5G476_9FIRM|nr:OsmC family protein [Desulfuribacillus alkaliarsenatis]OEF97895.1 peroxiredoxin [Desulfuribacillus alkaliarsenatis]